MPFFAIELFLLADNFQSSLEKLNGEEQKAAKLATFHVHGYSWHYLE